MSKPFLKHLKSREDLVTPYEAVRAGFVALALEKNRRATPFVAMARALKASASQAKKPHDLLKIIEIRAALLTAAGVSDKAKNHLQASDKTEAIKGLIETFLEPAGVNFVEELVFRFLLTRGDTLGGSMRNVGGFLAQKKLTRSLLAHFKLAGQSCQWLHTKTRHGRRFRATIQMLSCSYGGFRGPPKRETELLSTISRFQLCRTMWIYVRSTVWHPTFPRKYISIRRVISPSAS
jgi:hypothetical protein